MTDLQLSQERSQLSISVDGIRFLYVFPFLLPPTLQNNELVKFSSMHSIKNKMEKGGYKAAVKGQHKLLAYNTEEMLASWLFSHNVSVLSLPPIGSFSLFHYPSHFLQWVHYSLLSALRCRKKYYARHCTVDTPCWTGCTDGYKFAFTLSSISFHNHRLTKLTTNSRYTAEKIYMEELVNFMGTQGHGTMPLRLWPFQPSIR